MPAINVSQSLAIAATGNVIVTAGAGTGKTRTLVERCLARILDPAHPCGLDRLLVVTFTDAAATEMRRRIRERLAQEELTQPGNAWIAEQGAQVDTAAIGTLHGFCARLVREHFHELALDPDLAVLDEGRTAVLRHEVLSALVNRRYADSSPRGEAFRDLVSRLGRGSDGPVAELVLRLHDQARARPDPGHWLDRQIALWATAGPDRWLTQIVPELERWRAEWRIELSSLRPRHPLLAELADLFDRNEPLGSPPVIAGFLREAAAFGKRGRWPRGETAFRKPVEGLLKEAAGFLEALGEDQPGSVLRADWEQVCGPMRALLELTCEFDGDFARARREAAAVDFSDLEHLALELLEDNEGRPSALARELRERFDHVLVDEYQDINAVQDRLLTALSREGSEANRFLVGDLKQSIYGFRLADPRLFRGCIERSHADGSGTVIPLQANFRSHPAILDFVNEVFAGLMRPEVGGVDFDESSRLLPGDPDRPWPEADPPVEVLLCAREADDPSSPGIDEGGEGAADATSLDATEREATSVAARLRQLHQEGLAVREATGETRPVRWSDMVVLLRSPSGKAEAYAKVFEQAGVPLTAARTGLFRAIECLDLLNLLRLLDNPLQDLPVLAVLRSPLVGMEVNELALIRLHERSGDFWTALRRFAQTPSDTCEPLPGTETASGSMDAAELASLARAARSKAVRFLHRHARWRDLARQTSLSECLEIALAETRYEDWLLTQPRGSQRRANVRRLLDLARDFDQFQRQSLHRFLRFVEAQQEAEFDPEPAAAEGIDAVRLLSIHKSKGLEFPVVVVANLGGRFNETDLRQPMLLDEALGLCPSVDLADPPRRHPTLPLLLARRRQAADLRGEELRLLYVAFTRASQKLLLAGTAGRRTAVPAEAPEASLAIPNKTGKLADGKETTPPETEGFRRDTCPALPLRRLREARSPLDWLLPLLEYWTGDPAWLDRPEGRCAHFAWRAPTAEATLLEQPGGDRPGASATPAPLMDALAMAHAQACFTYLHQAATHEPAKSSVTVLRKRALEDESEREARVLFHPARSDAFPALRLEPDGKSLSAAERGTAHHRFLQFAALDRLASQPDIAEQAAALVAAGRLGSEEATALDLSALAAFGRSPLADRLREPGVEVRRELEFTLRLSPADGAALALPTRTGLAEDEGIVVQGVVDVAALTDTGIWLLDFKTDAVTATSLAEKVAAYTPQLALYALALSRIFERPVTGAWLHFLAADQSVPVALPSMAPNP